MALQPLAQPCEAVIMGTMQYLISSWIRISVDGYTGKALYICNAAALSADLRD